MAGEQFNKGAIQWLRNNRTAQKFVDRLMQTTDMTFGEAVGVAKAQREAGILDKAGALSSAQKKQVSQDVTGGKTVAEAVKHATTPAPTPVPESARINSPKGEFTAEDVKKAEQPYVDEARKHLNEFHELNNASLPNTPAPSAKPAPDMATPESGFLKDRLSQYGKLAAGGGLALAGMRAASRTDQEPEAARSDYVTEKHAVPEMKPAIPTLGEDGRTLKDTIKAATAPEQKEQKVTPEQIAKMLPKTQMKPEKKKDSEKPQDQDQEAGGEGEGEEGEKQTPVQKILSHFSEKLKETRGGLKKDLEGQLDKMQTLETTYRTEANEAKDSVARQELAEKMGHALAQLGAGMQGIKTGVDMTSGLKFDKTDWNKRYETALDELKANLTDLREKRQEARLTSQEAMRQAESETERGMSLATQEQIRGEDRTERAKEKKDQLALRKEDLAFRDKESKLQRGWEQKKLEDTLALKKEEVESRSLREQDKRTWQTQQNELKRQNDLQIAKIGAMSKGAAADAKGDKKDLAEISRAQNNLVAAYTLMKTGDKTQQTQGEKEYQQHRETLNSHFNDGGKTIMEIENLLEDTPLFSTTAGFLKRQAPLIAGKLAKKVQAAGVPPLGQAPVSTPESTPSAAPASAPTGALQPTADEIPSLMAYQKKYPDRSQEELLRAMRKK